MAVVIALVCGWRAITYGRGYKLRQLAEQVERVGAFSGTPLPNSTCKQILYAQTTDIGLAVFVGDPATGRKFVVREMAERSLRSQVLRPLGWSPDDKLFAYDQPAKEGRQDIVICSGLVAERIATIYTSNSVEGFTWVSPTSFAYLDGSQSLRVVSQGSYGVWRESSCHRKVGSKAITDLAAISDKRVAWKDGRAIKVLDLYSGDTETLWKSSPGKAMNFTFSSEQQTLLVSSSSGNDFELDSIQLAPSRQTNRLFKTDARRLVRAQHVNKGKGFVIICDDLQGRSLLLSKNGEYPNQSLFVGGNVQTLMAEGNKLYLRASTNSEPPAIWEFDLSADNMRCLFAGVDRAFAPEQTLRHSSFAITNNNREIRYHLWMPQQDYFGRKHPLVIGQTPYGWTPFPHVAAAANCCWVTINRATWEIGLSTWASDVLAVYEDLKRQEKIDFRKVYLYGRSAETVPLSELAAERPELWRGAILFSPTLMPDLSRCRLKTLLLDCGEYDSGTYQEVVKYQTDAAVSRGIPTTLLVHETARHTSFSRITAANRCLVLGYFLCRQ